MKRREFLTAAAGIGLAGALSAGTSLAGDPKARPSEKTAPADSNADGTLVIDAHAHMFHRSKSNWKEMDRRVVEAADKLGIDQLCCSILTPKRPATAEGFQECNRWMADCMKRFPGRILGYCYVNPTHTKEALEDIRRCVEDRGFMGVKLYNEHRCTEPVVYPIVELAIELRVPILHHAGHMHFFLETQPKISDGSHLSELARRYPEAMLICAHAGGGGDWEWEIKSLRNAPSVYLDTSGSVIDEGMVEMCVDILGADRVLFACDNSMTPGMGKLIGAQLSKTDRRKLLGLNMKKILEKRKQS
ncbi:MAG: amidohydrolase family protein [Pirellulales bacterium]|nr:amidohydrolase family protein [Pirellulales bacterium]